jgi:RNA 2',3'-cyclic 3'-phosphodiesterase
MSSQRPQSPKARLFVALELPEDVRAGIVAWQRRELRDPALRPTRPEALHMTLAFLGYHPEDAIEAIAAAALVEGLAAPRMRLAPEPVGVPRGRHPRLYALEAASDGAMELQARVSASLQAAGFYEPQKRPFWPHLTVARVRPEGRGSKRPASVSEAPGALSGVLEHTFVSVRMRLYRSYLRQQGAEYVSLASLELNPDS